MEASDVIKATKKNRQLKHDLMDYFGSLYHKKLARRAVDGRHKMSPHLRRLVAIHAANSRWGGDTTITAKRLARAKARKILKQANAKQGKRAKVSASG